MKESLQIIVLSILLLLLTGLSLHPCIKYLAGHTDTGSSIINQNYKRFLKLSYGTYPTPLPATPVIKS